MNSKNNEEKFKEKQKTAEEKNTSKNLFGEEYVSKILEKISKKNLRRPHKKKFKDNCS